MDEIEISAKQAIEFSFGPIIGIPCWGVFQGHGSFFELNFGNPSLKITEPHPKSKRRRRMVVVKGDWLLLLWCCSWKIEFLSSSLKSVDSESSRTSIAKAASYLSGQKLESVDICAESGTSRFEFDLGASLTTASYDPPLDDEGEPYENWMLFQGNQVLVFKSNGLLTLGPSGENDVLSVNRDKSSDASTANCTLPEKYADSPDSA